MEENIFLDHIINSLQKSMENAIKQFGKSDIEPPTYVEDTKEWYRIVLEKVYEQPPCDFVKAITVFEDKTRQITGIDYKYYGQDERINNTTINIFSDR